MAEEIQMEEGNKKGSIGGYFRSGSCIGDPKVITIRVLKRGLKITMLSYL